MTDNEIIKALECCRNNEREDECKYCLSCPMAHCELDEDEELNCMDAVYKRALDLIKQQKAEIEGLQTVIFNKEDTMQLLHKEHPQTVDELQHENAELQRKNAELQYENLQMIASIKKIKSELFECFGNTGKTHSDTKREATEVWNTRTPKKEVEKSENN